MKRWILLITAAAALTLGLLGCSTLDEKQRAWIFQPGDRSWGNSAEAARGMDDTWIEYLSTVTERKVRLHGLWLPSAKADAPVLLYLHGARWNVAGSAGRIRRMQELGFSVLAIDYRGFGQTSRELPSEAMASEDARAAWDWLAARYPERKRFIFGHSLGGAIAIDLASKVGDEAGTIVEGTFTSISDVVSATRWGWVPVGPLLTQRFEALRKVADINSPLLVVHGERDTMIPSDLGRKLFEAARGPKAFVLVEGGSHFNTNAVGQQQYRKALAELFALG
jgi:uncharacterized protein